MRTSIVSAQPLRDMQAPDLAHARTIARRVPNPRAWRRTTRKRWSVAIFKRVLPVAAVALLCMVAFWPELAGQRARFTYRRELTEPLGGEITRARYHGLDERGRPYTMTAATARQLTADRVDLTAPKGDVTMESGGWMMVQSKTGVYAQHTQILDLSGDVTLYRDDGTVLQTASATVDLKSGTAVGSQMVHAEGPFGTLDAQGFSLTDRGEVVRFAGPGRLVMNGHSK